VKILFAILFFISLVLELFSIYVLFYTSNFEEGILWFFPVYTLAVLLLSISLYPIYRYRFRDGFFKPFLFLLLISFLVPVIGYLFPIVFSIISFFLMKEKTIIETKNQPLKEILTEEISLKKISYGESFLKKAIEEVSIHKSLKEEAVLILSRFQSPLAVHLLKEAVYSDIDEVRLLALNFLYKQEKQINRKISELISRIKSTKEALEGAQILKELAFLYWELVYLELTDTEFSRYYLEQALKYTLEALNVVQNDDKLYLLLGRIYLKKEDIENAEKALHKSILLNPNNISAYIYLAEVEFNKRNFERIKELLKNLKNIEKDYLSYSIVSVWRK